YNQSKASVERCLKERPSVDPFANATQLVAEGRFAAALQVLEASSSPRDRDHRDVAVLRAELLERVGRVTQSRTLVDTILKTRDLSESNRSACELILGRPEWESGNVEAGVLHIQRAAAGAAQCGDLRRLCWSQMRLLLNISSRSDPGATSPLMAE